MGVVIRQSFWSTLVAYIGVAVGYLNTLFLRPAFLDVEEIGLFTLVTSNALLFSSLSMLGMNGAFVKLFPELAKTPRLMGRMMGFMLILVGLTSAGLFLLAIQQEAWIEAWFVEKAPAYTSYIWVSACILVFHALFDILLSYSRSILQVILPTFLRDVVLRLGTTILLLLYGFEVLDFPTTIVSLIWTFAITFLIFFVWLIIQGMPLRFGFGSIPQTWYRRLFLLSGYMLLLAGSYAVLQNVTYLQISTLIGLEAQGVFVTCFYIGMIVEMPSRNMMKVISPIFAQAFSANNLDEVASMYRKGSLTISIIGSLLCIGILTNVEDLFSFIPKGDAFRAGLDVVYLICLAKLVTMFFGYASELIVYSSRHRANLYIQLLGAVVLVISNSLLIPHYGIVGAGISYLLAMLLLALGRFIFIQRVFGLSPFTRPHATLVLISLGTYLVFYLLPLPFGSILNIVIRSAATAGIYLLLVYRLNLSKDINGLMDNIWQRIYRLVR